MILQRALSFTKRWARYRIVLETSGASNFRIVELHWRDFAVFVSLSSRTNTRQGLKRLCDCIRRVRAGLLREQAPDPTSGIERQGLVAQLVRARA
jgi:hypothetical protein